MNGIPLWAKLVASTLGAAALALATFVTRYEFNALDARLAAIQATTTDILFKVGGNEARDIVPPTDLPCVPEDASPKLQAALDDYWQDAKMLAKSTTTKPRPRFCFADYVVVVQKPEGGYDRLLGVYSGKTNQAFVALMRSELRTLGRCAVLHEMMHAIVGPKENAVNSLLPECLPSTGPNGR